MHDTTIMLCLLSIPDFNDAGYLPPGVHAATLAEIDSRFGWNKRRRKLCRGLRKAVANLKAAGCERVYIDGSFVTNKSEPGDFDGCWEAAGVDPDVLDPILLDFTFPRAAQKAKYGGELFIANAAAEPGGTQFLRFFQNDKHTGEPKGILVLTLRKRRQHD